MELKINNNYALTSGQNNSTKIENEEFNRLLGLDETHNKNNKDNFQKRFIKFSLISLAVLFSLFLFLFHASWMKSIIWSAILGSVLGYIITKRLEEKTSDSDILQSIHKIISQYNYGNFKNIYTYRIGRDSFVVNSAGLIIMNEWHNKLSATVLFPQNILSARINTDTELQTTTKQSGSFTVGAGKGLFGGYSTGRKAQSKTVAVHKHRFELRYQLSANSNVQLKTIDFGSNRVEADNLCDLVQNLR